MIDSESLAVAAKPGVAEGMSIPSGADSENGVQLTDPEQKNFDETFISHISDLTEADIALTGDGLPVAEVAGEAAMGGKELPLFSAAAPSAETELIISDELEPALLLDEESDKVIAAAPLLLSNQVEQERLLEPQPTALMKQVNKDAQFTRQAPDNAKAEILLAVRADELVLKPDFSSRHFDLMSSGAALTERSADSTTLASITAMTKSPALETASQAASPARLSIGVPVQQAKWADNLASRVTYMLMNNQQSAQISLNPADLGPIEVKVNLQNDQANVNFYAQNGSVRDAIEEAFPRLRDMLNENGLNLGQSSVSDQSLSQKQGQSEPALQDPFHQSFMEETEATDAGVSELVRIKLGLVDHFV